MRSTFSTTKPSSEPGFDFDSIKIDESAIIIENSLPHEDLLKALYWVYDFMDRALINFFLVGKTAESMMAREDLVGDKLTVGVRKVEWLGGSRRIIDAFTTPLKEDENTVEYEFEGVPVLVYLLDDDATIQSPDQRIYHSEFFKFPNPYSRFQEVFPWVK